MTQQRDPQPDKPSRDARLHALADAILEGAPVDWSAVDDDSTALRNELRLLADIAGIHRSLAHSDPGALNVGDGDLPFHIGSIVVTRMIGEGTFGRVFAGWDTRLHREVAVKVLRWTATGGIPAEEEGRLLARVRHPNVVAVYSAEEVTGQLALVTEFIEGETLQQVIATTGPLDAAEAMRVGIDLCGALDALHEAGLLHRDIKPHNVMRERGGRIVLTDFGAGEWMRNAQQSLAGTPLYLAPEILEGGAASVRSDIFSLGVLLHYAVTQAYPVRGTSIEEIRSGYAEGRRTMLRQKRPDLPRTFIDAVDRATSPSPADRPGSAAEFERTLRGQGPATHFVRSAAVAVCIALLLLLAVAAVWRTFRPLPSADVLGPRASPVQLPPYLNFGGSSLDGRFLVYVDPNGRVLRLDRETNHTRDVLEGTEQERRAWAAVPSPAGDRIAFAWPPDEGRSEIRIAVVEDRWPQSNGPARISVPIFTAAPGTLLLPLTWSADASTLLVASHRTTGPLDLVLVAADSGLHHVIRTFDGPRPRRSALSPDGRFVVYDLPARGFGGERDILIQSTAAGSMPTVLIGGPSDDQFPIWTSRENVLAFTSSRADVVEGWFARVEHGQLRSTPRRYATGMAGVTPVNLTTSGELLYFLQTAREEVFVVDLDARGRAIGPPAALPNQPAASRLNPAFAPDGRSLAHVEAHGRDLFDFRSAMRVIDLQSGASRAVYPELVMFGGLPFRWSPGSDELLMKGKGLDGNWGVFRVDVATGSTTRVLQAGTRGREEPLLLHDWSPHSRSILLGRKGKLIEHNVVTGEERALVEATDDAWVTGAGVSPDGNRVAFSLWEESKRRSTLAVRHSDGSIKVVLALDDGTAVAFRGWIDDERLIQAITTPGGRKLQIVPAIGGPAVDMGVLLAPESRTVSIRADGRQLAYSDGRTSFELWSMRGLKFR